MHYSHAPCGFRARVVQQRPLPGILNCANETDIAVNDERSVLASVARGDKDAFAGLYDRHVSLVYGIAKRITGNPAQAEDITQSVFTMLWAKPDFFGGGNFAAWVARVARNASLDVVRSAAVRTREPMIPLDLPAEGVLDEQGFERVRG